MNPCCSFVLEGAESVQFVGRYYFLNCEMADNFADKDTEDRMKVKSFDAKTRTTKQS